VPDETRDKQTKESPEVSFNVVVHSSQEEDAPPKHHRQGDSWKALERVKAKKEKEPSKAEQLFNQYCYPITQFWPEHERNIMKEASLKILSSEFAECIEGNGLKGHTRHNKIYHTDVGNLIIALVKYAHFHPLVDLPYLPRDLMRGQITKEFDEHFFWVSEMLQLAGERKDVIQRKGREWREKIQAAAVEFPPYWREIIWDKIWPGRGYVPKKQKPHMFAACKFADVFVGYVPKAPPARITKWVNIILTSLERPTVSESKLNDYISNSKKQERIPPGLSISITE
jgi:hypothetical protein